MARQRLKATVYASDFAGRRLHQHRAWEVQSVRAVWLHDIYVEDLGSKGYGVGQPGQWSDNIQ